MNRLQVPSYRYPYVQLALNHAAQWTTQAEVLLEPGVYRGDLVVRGDVVLTPRTIRHRPILGGLINEYETAA